MDLDFPAIYLLSCGFEKDRYALHQLETQMKTGAYLVWSIKEADVVIGKLNKPGRAAHELRKLGIYTRNVTRSLVSGVESTEEDKSPPPKKRQKTAKSSAAEEEVIVMDESTASESDSEGHSAWQKKTHEHQDSPKAPLRNPHVSSGKIVIVLRLDWYTESLRAGKLLPTRDYLVYKGVMVTPAALPEPTPKPTILPSKGVKSRFKADTPPRNQNSFKGHHAGGSQGRTHYHSQPPLLHQTTTEYEIDVPPIPEYLRTKYSCQRPTSLNGPNEDFVAQLRIIRKARKIQDDPIGELSYNKGIATIAAYPHTLTSTQEIQRLPNLSNKFASMWQTWKETGKIKEVEEIEADEDMKALSILFEIYDVGEKTANEFLKRGWKDLDDVVDNWGSLTRNQQIGVKFYDEFQQRMSRSEVENIGQIVLDHANKLRVGFQMVICGSYRRGKQTIGDVDVILSHPDEEATMNVLRDLLDSLEDPDGDGYITHELVFSMSNSERHQSTLKWRGTGPRKKKTGFDTLDHAFCVWQDREWSTKQHDRTKNPQCKNPNLHRRVDIIISPWKTAGCAVIGWSGAIMFERDLRKYCTATKGYKFDSSGVRRVDDGAWIDLEGFEEGFEGDLLAKEKRVFAQLELEWVEPKERNTD